MDKELKKELKLLRNDIHSQNIAINNLAKDVRYATSQIEELKSKLLPCDSEALPDKVSEEIWKKIFPDK